MLALVLFALALPQLNVYECPTPLPQPQQNWTQLGVALIGEFVLSSGQALPEQQTSVNLCWSDDALLVQFTAIDDEPYNPLTECNQDLYEHDVVEMFLSTEEGTVAPHYYLEFEVSPESVLFASHVANPNLQCAGIKDTPIPCNYSGLAYDASITSWGYYAFLQIPWSLVGVEPARGIVLRSNMFRIDTPSGSAKEYSAWSADYAVPPCFHMPSYFGSLVLS